MGFKIFNDKLGISKILRVLALIQMGISGIAFPIILMVLAFTSFDNHITKFNTISHLLDNVLVFTISFFIWRILNCSIKKHPFNKSNLNDLKILSVGLISYSVVFYVSQILITFLLDSWVMNPLEEISKFLIVEPKQGIILGLVVLSIREIIKIGVNLKSENELTV